MSVEEMEDKDVVFDGQRVQRIRNKLTGIKDWDSLYSGERVELREGDRGTLTLEWYVDSIEGKSKHDAAGHSIGALTRMQSLRVFDGSVQITAVVRREDRG